MRSDSIRSPAKARPSGGGATVVRLVVPPRSTEGAGPEPSADDAARARQVGPSDEVLVTAVQAGERWAAAALLERYAPMVERLVRRVLGHDAELEDLVQEALAAVLASIRQVREPAAVKGWIAQVAVHVAHRAIRKRKLQRWLLFWAPKPEEQVEPSIGPREALRRVYAVLDDMPADERVPFALRFIDEMPLEEVAATCGVSLATIKRRIARAEKKFLAMARRDPALATHIEEGDRWTIE